MIRILSANILSPLGQTTDENYEAVLAGRTALALHEGRWGLPEAFVASLFSEEQWQEISIEGMTRFESLVIQSARSAMRAAGVSASSDRLGLVVSTTKGNIELLEKDPSATSPAAAAKNIARHLGIVTEPIVASNACISSVAGLVLAQRLIMAGIYDEVIVTGCDVQGKFIISGFQSLKALSPEPCRPFDIERTGLNLGEAAATLILSRKPHGGTAWTMTGGAVRNDAFHITNPSPSGAGSRSAMIAALGGMKPESLALVNVHGTATMYNDQMESKAIEGAGLSDVPANALKGYFGHTMGAAGLLETIMTMRAVEDGLVLPTKGYSERGVSGRISVSAQKRATSERSFLKVISGFGGCNGAVAFSLADCGSRPQQCPQAIGRVAETHRVIVTASSVTLDGEVLKTEGSGKAMLTDAYRRYVGDYPRFYKMDILSRLGFLASELIAQRHGTDRETDKPDCGVVFFNSTSSLCSDIEYDKSIADSGNYYPSPSVFVYTLPNIVTGEIALRNRFRGETSLYILPERNDGLAEKVALTSFFDQELHTLLTGWIDAPSESDFTADLRLLVRQ